MLTLFGGGTASAVVSTWTGTGTTNWTTAGNWSANAVPGTGTDCIFTGTRGSKVNPYIADNPNNASSIVFQGDNWNILGAVGVSNARLKLWDATTMITNTVGNNTISVPSVSLAGGAGSAIYVGGGKILTINSLIGDATSGTYLLKTGAGELIISNPGNNWPTNTTVSAGVLTLGASGVIPDDNAVTVNGTLDLNGNDEVIGSLAGSGQVKGNSGGASLTLGGDNSTTEFTGRLFSGVGSSFPVIKNGSGTFTISGTLQNDDLALTVNAGTVVLSKTSTNTVHAVDRDAVVSGATLKLGGTGGDQIYDAHAVIVTSGAFDLNARSETIDTLNLAGDGIGGTGALVNNSSTSNSTLTCISGITLTTNAVIGGIGGITLSNTISGAFALTKAGAGTLMLAGANTYSGGTIIQTGTLLLSGGANRLKSGSDIAVTGTLDMNGLNQTFGSVTGSGSITTGGGVLTIGSGGSSFTNGVVISETGSLTKSGAGTVVLTGNNTYTGATTNNAGELSISGDINASTPVVVNGGTLSTTAGNKLNNSAPVIIAGGTLAVGGTETVGTLTMTSGTIGGSQTLTATTYNLSGGTVSGNLGGGTLNSSGTVVLNGLAAAAAVNVTAGTLTLGSNDRLADGATVNLAGGTLAMGANNDTVNALEFGGVGKARGNWGSTSSAAVHKSSRFTGTGILTVTNGGTSTTVLARTAGSSPSTYGNSLTFTATVTSSGGIPMGTVTFKDGTNTLGNDTLSGGAGNSATASLTIANLKKATHSLIAEYGGDDSFDVSVSAAVTHVVTAKALTVTNAVVVPKVYDGLLDVVITGAGLNGLINGDVVTLNGQGYFDAGYSDVVVGTNIPVITEMSLGGADAANYSLTQPTLTGDMLPKPLSIVGLTTGAKVYDGATNASISGTAALLSTEDPGTGSVSDGRPYNTDTVGVAGSPAGAFADRNVATNKPVMLIGITLTGFGAGNYTVSSETGLTADITVRPLTVTAGSNTKVYDGNTSATNVPAITSGALQALDTANFIVTYDTADVGTGKTLTPSGTVSDGNGGTNYSYTLVSSTNGIIESAIGVATPPIITGVSPNIGRTNGGTLVTITGSNFLAGVTVRFGGNAPAVGSLIDSNTLTSSTPPNGAGQVDVIVINTNGLSATNQFTYVLPAPPVMLGSSELSGTNLNLIWVGGTNATCTLLTATNVADAPTSWISVATNVVGADGLSSNSLPIDLGELQRFYLLSVPYY